MDNVCIYVYMERLIKKHFHFFFFFYQYSPFCNLNNLFINNDTVTIIICIQIFTNIVFLLIANQ